MMEYQNNLPKCPEGLELQWRDEGLTLVGGNLELRGDFAQMVRRLSAGNLQREFLVKAARIKGFDGPVTVLDATAGMGEDSMLLAAAGFQVKLYEYDPVIAALLRDALRRASLDPKLSDAAARMEFVEGDSIAAMQRITAGAEPDLQRPDVVLLDPMFPSRTKSAMIKKKFQLLQKLERPCSDEEELLSAAFAADPYKIVIKRPLKGPYLAGRKPDYSLSGKAIRYDCILVRPGERRQ